MWVKQCHQPSMTGTGKHTLPLGDGADGIVLATFFYPALESAESARLSCICMKLLSWRSPLADSY